MHTGSFVLTPAQSKRLLAKAVACLKPVEQAKTNGRLIVANGTTNAYILEELGHQVDKALYTAGVVTDGRYCATPSDKRIPPLCFEGGAVSKRPWQDILSDFTKDDVFIKGANAVDLEGNIGVLVGDKNGGTIGKALGTVLARGAHFIVPVGLEKLIPSVPAASQWMGINNYHCSLGMGSGLIATSQAWVITEIDALSILYNVEATMVSSGGVGGSEGSVGFVISGDKQSLEQAMHDLRLIKQEPNLQGTRQVCSTECPSHCHWLKS